MICPFCGSKSIDVPTVDIGVGEQQCAPASCNDCGASQFSHHGPGEEATEEERKAGWWRGPPVDNLPGAEVTSIELPGGVKMDVVSIPGFPEDKAMLAPISAQELVKASREELDEVAKRSVLVTNINDGKRPRGAE